MHFTAAHKHSRTLDQPSTLSPLNEIKSSHPVNLHQPTHTSFRVACSREQGNFVNIPTKEEVYCNVSESLTLLKKKKRKIF